MFRSTFPLAKIALATLALFSFTSGDSHAQGAWPPAKPTGQDWETGIYNVGGANFKIEYVLTSTGMGRSNDLSGISIFVALSSSIPSTGVSITVTGSNFITVNASNQGPPPVAIKVDDQLALIYQSVHSNRGGANGVLRGITISALTSAPSGTRSATTATPVHYFYKYKITQLTGTAYSSVQVRVANGTAAFVSVGGFGGGTGTAWSVARSKSVQLGPLNGPVAPPATAGSQTLTRDTDDFRLVALSGNVGYFWGETTLNIPTNQAQTVWGIFDTVAECQQEVIPLEVIP